MTDPEKSHVVVRHELTGEDAKTQLDNWTRYFDNDDLEFVSVVNANVTAAFILNVKASDALATIVANSAATESVPDNIKLSIVDLSDDVPLSSDNLVNKLSNEYVVFDAKSGDDLSQLDVENAIDGALSEFTDNDSDEERPDDLSSIEDSFDFDNDEGGEDDEDDVDNSVAEERARGLVDEANAAQSASMSNGRVSVSELQARLKREREEREAADTQDEVVVNDESSNGDDSDTVVNSGDSTGSSVDHTDTVVDEPPEQAYNDDDVVVDNSSEGNTAQPEDAGDTHHNANDRVIDEDSVDDTAVASDDNEPQIDESKSIILDDGRVLTLDDDDANQYGSDSIGVDINSLSPEEQSRRNRIISAIDILVPSDPYEIVTRKLQLRGVDDLSPSDRIVIDSAHNNAESSLNFTRFDVEAELEDVDPNTIRQTKIDLINYFVANPNASIDDMAQALDDEASFANRLKRAEMEIKSAQEERVNAWINKYTARLREMYLERHPDRSDEIIDTMYEENLPSFREAQRASQEASERALPILSRKLRELDPENGRGISDLTRLSIMHDAAQRRLDETVKLMRAQIAEASRESETTETKTFDAVESPAESADTVHDDTQAGDSKSDIPTETATFTKVSSDDFADESDDDVTFTDASDEDIERELAAATPAGSTTVTDESDDDFFGDDDDKPRNVGDLLGYDEDAEGQNSINTDAEDRDTVTLGEVDDDSTNETAKSKSRKRMWMGIGGGAAAVLALAGGLLLLPKMMSDGDNPKDSASQQAQVQEERTTDESGLYQEGDTLRIVAEGKIQNVTIVRFVSAGAIGVNDDGQEFGITQEQLDNWAQEHPDQFTDRGATQEDNSAEQIQNDPREAEQNEQPAE